MNCSTFRTVTCLVFMGAVAARPALSQTSPAQSFPEADRAPHELQRWLVPQRWQRDTDGPIVSLGTAGDFDDAHVYGPAVAIEDGTVFLWYCGSRGTVGERVFRLGLATSRDGRKFDKHPDNPIYSLGDERFSILTPTLLCGSDGSVLRENGRLRMWFSRAALRDPNGPHTLHETTSRDGMHWSPPSRVLHKHVFAPSILKTGASYQMWFTDVAAQPWVFRHAVSSDGQRWQETPEPVLKVDQSWERDQLFYPTVLSVDGVYLMWYGSYWSGRPNTTALGFAVSLDGLRWYKHPDNPVLRPDPDRPWESHYVTSQTVHRLADGSFRIWYSSRTQPPYEHKYFALNTALWKGLDSAVDQSGRPLDDFSVSPKR